ncbi:MAG: hypothetical protein Q8P07_02950, partial [bacterium]|nr:hypothetical protein [bacterium]
MLKNYTVTSLKRRYGKLVSVFLVSFLAFSYFTDLANSAPGIPRIISYQGRLANSSGTLQGSSSGTNFYFKFSLHDASSDGNQLWPANNATACTHTLSVVSGVFNANIGDTSECSDVLDYDFTQSDSVYLQVQVSEDNVDFESLTPRQRINSSAFAVTADTLMSTSTQSRIGTMTPIGSSLLTIQATSTNSILLTLRGFLNQAANIFQVQDSAGGDIFTISGGGKIGVSTSTPSTNLSVQGDGLFSGNLSVANLIATGTLAIGGTTKFNNQTYTWPSSIVAGNFLQTDGSGNLTWAAVSSGGGSDTNWTYISTDGGFMRLATTTNRVGIGTTTPYAKLSVESSTGAIATTTFALRPVSGQTANIIDIYNTSGALTTVLDSSNRFGLGTTSPSEVLSVTGNILTTGTIQTSGTATSTWASSGLSVAGGGLVSSNGLTITGGNILLTSGATSTFNNGIKLTAGCFLDSSGNCITTNANTLDSIDSTQFLRSDTSDNYTSGTLTFDSGTTLTMAAGSTFGSSITGTSTWAGPLATAGLSSTGGLTITAG